MWLHVVENFCLENSHFGRLFWLSSVFCSTSGGLIPRPCGSGNEAKPLVTARSVSTVYRDMWREFVGRLC